MLIQALKIANCSDSAVYAQEEMNMYLRNRDLYPELQIRPLKQIGTTIGYIISRGSPGQVVQIGPEAYIFNCPIEIQVSFNPTGIDASEKLFDQMLQTIKVWKSR